MRMALSRGIQGQALGGVGRQGAHRDALVDRRGGVGARIADNARAGSIRCRRTANRRSTGVDARGLDARVLRRARAEAGAVAGGRRVELVDLQDADAVAARRRRQRGAW